MHPKYSTFDLSIRSENAANAAERLKFGNDVI